MVKKAHMLEDPPLQIVFADGFHAMQQIDNYLDQCILANKSAFIAISGQSGTGRSVAASYVLRRWQSKQNIEADRYIVPDVGPIHNDPSAIFVDWFTTVARKAGHVTQVNPAIRAALGVTIQQPGGSAYAFNFNPHAVSYGQVLRAAHPAAGAAVCLDDITKVKYLADCQEIFDGSSMLCVCTMTPELSAGANLNDWKVIALNALQGNDVAAFINDYWQNFTQRALPFDIAVVQRAFAQKSYTITKVRTLMRELLISKVVFAPNDPWDDIAFARALQFAEAGVNAPAVAAGAEGGQ